MEPDSVSLVSLARVLALLQDPRATVEDQRAAFRAFLARHGDQELALAVRAQSLVFNGVTVPIDGDEALDYLRRELLRRGIGEVRLPGGMPAAQLLGALRTVVGSNEQYPRLQQRLDHLTAEGVRGVDFRPPLPEDSAREEDHRIEALGVGASTEMTPELIHFMSAERQTSSETEQLLADLEAAQTDTQISDLLDAVVSFGEMAAQTEIWNDVLTVGARLAELEDRATHDEHRRLYGIALRRLVPRFSLERVVEYVPSGAHKIRAVAILRSYGGEATEVLLRKLVAATDVGERRSYFSAILHMREGHGLLVNMLDHDEWFVVRNVADLCGEMGLTEALPGLARAMDHRDERVRRSAAGALAKIGTVGAMDPLRRALVDAATTVRLQAAMTIGGAGFRNLVPAIVGRIDHEEEVEIRQELLHTLGRIGTEDAIRVLADRALPARRLFRRRPLGARLAAIEGLRTAGGRTAMSALKRLEDDRDEEVRSAAGAARRALESAEES